MQAVKIIFIAISLFLAGFHATANDLEGQLQNIRQRIGELKYEQCVELTEPLLAKHHNDVANLIKIYELRLDFARRRTDGSWMDARRNEAAELTSLLGKLPEGLYLERINYTTRYIESGHHEETGQLYHQAFPENFRAFVQDDVNRIAVIKMLSAAVGKYRTPVTLSEGKHALDKLLSVLNREDPDEFKLFYDPFVAYFGSQRSRSWIRVRPQDIYPLCAELKAIVDTPGVAPYASGILSIVAELEEELQLWQELLNTSEMLINFRSEDTRPLIRKAKALSELGSLEQADAALKEVILKFPESPEAFDARKQFVHNALSDGDLQKACGRGRLLFDIAMTSQQMTEAIHLFTQVLARHDGHLGRVNQFLGQQRQELPKELALPIERSVGKEFKSKLLAAAEEPVDFMEMEELKRRGMLYMHAGEPEMALAVFQTMYLSVSSEKGVLETGPRYVALALRAKAFHIHGDRVFNYLQKYGPAGKDGVVGTEDDLSFSFPEVRSLSNEVIDQQMAEFHRAISNSWYSEETVDAGMKYASTLAVSGFYDEAISVTVGLFSATRDEKAFSKACMAVAAAFRSRDLNLINANNFLNNQVVPKNEEKVKPANPLDSFTVKLPSAHAQWLTNQAEEFVREKKYRDAAYAYLHLGDVQKSLSALKRARAHYALDESGLNEMTRDLLTAFKALNGHPFGPEVIVDFVQYGPDGKDGIPGTEFDLVDPLAGY